MNKKELIKFAHNLLPIRNHFGSRKDRMQNWILMKQQWEYVCICQI